MPITPYQVKDIRYFTELDISLSRSQERRTWQYSEPNKSRRHRHISCPVYLDIIRLLDLPSGIFHWEPRLKICTNFSCYPREVRKNSLKIYIYICNSPYSQSVIPFNRPMSRDSVVGIATVYWLDDRGVEVRVPVVSKIFCYPRRPDRTWGPPKLLLSNW
jgi:hypothetical protein